MTVIIMCIEVLKCVLASKLLAYRRGVIVLVFKANRGESEANAKRESRARGRALKITRLYAYYNSSCSGVKSWMRLPHQSLDVMLKYFSNTTWLSHHLVVWMKLLQSPFVY